ncbi:hypothetical protein DERF_005141 [Dermatophagoides farinae]|uniref:Uncharacterized protein n=1 Tax=Dermatophagoides farinae TaxID=6954 RepID=A0A922I597_DERFA|nr:hypothetical protein DERF_005141 [Dermatophagoides farinae]
MNDMETKEVIEPTKIAPNISYRIPHFVISRDVMLNRFPKTSSRPLWLRPTSSSDIDYNPTNKLDRCNNNIDRYNNMERLDVDNCYTMMTMVEDYLRTVHSAAVVFDYRSMLIVAVVHFRYSMSIAFDDDKSYTTVDCFRYLTSMVVALILVLHQVA